MNEDKAAKAVFGLGCLLWIVSALVSIGITVGIIYIVLHFVLKFW